MAIYLDNVQYGKFVQFAEQQIQAGNEKAIARDGGGLAGHTIVAATSGDKVASFWRSQADKDANNAARDLFRQSIVDMFGSEAAIPRSVRDAMNLDDFDQGKPLTARRIIAVKAEVDRIVSAHTAFNNGLAENLVSGRFEQLPQDVQDGLAQLVNDLRAVFGADAVPPNVVITNILHQEHIRGEVDVLRKAANAQGRDLTSAEIQGLYATKAFDRLATTTVGAFILAKFKAREPDNAYTSLSLGSQFEMRHPGLLAEIRLCKNPGDIAIVLQNHEAEIDAFVDVTVRSNAAFKAVEADAESALAECGITDAKVCRDVKAAMLQRGRAVFAGATGLKGLLDFVAVVKAEATALAQTLDGIAKLRSGALNVAATVVSVSSGIGKAYVMNNLDTSPITSDSGKLRFLYDNVLAKARNGDGVDRVGSLNKANDIIAKFARGKADILKAIDEAGFDPAERAAHRLAALRDPGWTDPEVTKVAKGLAENETLKGAARLFAGALTGDAAQSLDDSQMRDVFLVFGKAFLTTLKTVFKEQAERWSGSIETQQRLMKMVFQMLEKEQSGIAEALARLVASGRFGTVRNLLSEGLNGIHARKMDFMTLKDYNLMGPPAGEQIRLVMGNPNLQYDEAAFQACQAEDELYNVTSMFVGVFGSEFPTSGAFNADKYIASVTTGRAVIATYADGLTQETVPLLAKLVGVLDWRGDAAAASEEIVKKFVEDMKTWRDIVPGSPDANGLKEVLQRRMNGYLKDVLAGNTNASFNTGNYPGLFQTFLDDLPRCTYKVNGKKILGETLQEKIGPYMAAIKDPAKRKVVSVMINQQLYGDYTASVSNRIPFAGWKNDMPDEPVDTIPGIENFASRDVMKTGLQIFDSGPMEFAIDVSPDESTVTVHAKVAYPIHADYSLPSTMIGTCTVSQEFVIDLTGAEPEIRDLKIGQSLR